MRLRAGLVKIGIGVSLALSLASCDSATNTNDDFDEYSPTDDLSEGYIPETVITEDAADNPCLASWVIQGMKSNIRESSLELLNNQRTVNDGYQILIDSAEIEFSFITNPNVVDRVIKCSAQADVTYIGNEGTSDAIVTEAARLIHNERSRYSFMNMGITAYNIDEFKSMGDDGFSVNVDYEISSTYSESGEESASYNAQIGSAATMLASIVAFDQYTQNLAEQKAQAPARLQAMRERIAAEDAATRAKILKADNEYYEERERLSALEEAEPTYDLDASDEVVVLDPQ